MFIFICMICQATYSIYGSPRWMFGSKDPNPLSFELKTVSSLNEQLAAEKINNCQKSNSQTKRYWVLFCLCTIYIIICIYIYQYDHNIFARRTDFAAKSHLCIFCNCSTGAAGFGVRCRDMLLMFLQNHEPTSMYQTLFPPGCTDKTVSHNAHVI